ncbi:MAG: hypothetical protein WEC59_06005, partial [Salibacteraceae bacterium]
EQDFEQAWKKAMNKLAERFGQPIDLQAALFLIGVNELGQGPRRFNKDQKIDVMHLAVCRLLEPFGYYEYVGNDKDGWPHYERTERLPKLNAKEQEQMIKEALISYIQEW